MGHPNPFMADEFPELFNYKHPPKGSVAYYWSLAGAAAHVFWTYVSVNGDRFSVTVMLFDCDNLGKLTCGLLCLLVICTIYVHSAVQLRFRPRDMGIVYLMLHVSMENLVCLIDIGPRVCIAIVLLCAAIILCRCLFYSASKGGCHFEKDKEDDLLLVNSDQATKALTLPTPSKSVMMINLEGQTFYFTARFNLIIMLYMLCTYCPW
ncbi:hypothetical protein COLO4_17571 [Corchorus olitorius]|uniref:Uncharacterized protein n=1 Tax=Corchorus olitorius TaxID=93759 RepID=A0A1R3JC74_9ROSI|nr:hypothetical protein COLO4_17571 [Corchorus olitorius]